MKLELKKGLKEFNADPRRARSGECDYGGWWTPTGDPMDFPRYSVSWIEKTGEIYVWNSREDEFQVIGHAKTEKEADRLLEGWADPDDSIYHNLTALLARF